MSPGSRSAALAAAARPRKPVARPASAGGRVAVVDIGSNSIRLVVFDGLKRVPTPLFNEKVLCGLGRGLDETGLLNPEGVPLAMESLGRFIGLAGAMTVGDLELVAPEASDGYVRQQYRILVRVDNEDGALRPGMTGVARFEAGRAPLYRQAADKLARVFRIEFWI